jgi:peptidoglycan/LPS O-acetylase OafA/YrhL
VFFVISGYLMASLIGKDVRNGRFTLSGFYERRALRILPALFAMLLASTLVAAVLAAPQMFKDFGRALVGAVTFSSNILFWRQSANYFDASAAWNPLLHTWSLGVEEQFYLLFPVYMLFAWRLGRPSPLRTTMLLAAMSFALSIWATFNAPTANFYLLPTRAWELLLGSMVAMREENRRAGSDRWPVGYIGLGLVAASFFFLDDEVPFPGLAALAPSLGAALILQSGGTGTNSASRWLSAPQLRFVGLISYSLYLWHWPVLVFADRYSPLGPLSGWQRGLALAVAFGLAAASWKWVEQPFRQPFLRNHARRNLAVAILASTLVAACGWVVVAGNGWTSRFPGINSVAFDTLNPAGVASSERQYDRRCFVDRIEAWQAGPCTLTGGAEGRALLWGDSFAASWAYGFLEHPEASISVLEYTSPGCPPILGYAPPSKQFCRQFNENAVKVARAHGVDTLILAASWSKYFQRRKLDLDDIARTVARLHTLGFRVILIGQSPTFSFSYPDDYFYRVAGPNRLADATARVDVDPSINDRMREVAHADIFFDPIRQWCDGFVCPFKTGPAYLFSDYGHYTMAGSAAIVGELLVALHGQSDKLTH